MFKKNVALPPDFSRLFVRPELDYYTSANPLSPSAFSPAHAGTQPQVPDFNHVALDSIATYMAQVARFSDDAIVEAQRFLSDFFSQNPFPGADMSVLTTGSDGRAEKSSYSKVDLIVAYRLKTATSVEMLDYIQRFKNALEGQRLLFSLVVRPVDISSDSVMCVENNTSASFPTRVIDAKPLFGSQDVFNMFKLSKFLEELQARKAADKLKNFSQKKKEALDIVLSGGQQTFKRRTLEHFRVDREQVTIFYNSGDDGTPKLSGPKFGFLRTVQYGVALAVCKALKGHSLSEDQYRNMPANIVARLDYLNACGKLSLTNDEVAQLKKAYQFFIFLYHLSEEQFLAHSHKEITLSGDFMAQFREMSKIVSDTFSGDKFFIKNT